MGYDTYVTCYVTLKDPRKANAFERAMKKIATTKVNNGAFVAKGIGEAENFVVRGGGRIEWNDIGESWRNLYEVEELDVLMPVIAKFVRPGWIYFEGETRDGDFAVRFDGKDGWKRLSRLDGYGDVYEVFMEAHAKQLPKPVVKALQEWRKKVKVADAL